MNKEIVKYFQQNQNSKNKEDIAKELIAKGYTEQEIKESSDFLYICSNPLKRDFWDFDKPKIYCRGSEKLIDFLLGFFVPFVFLILNIVPILGFLVYVGFYFYFVFYFFRRRNWITVGMILNLIFSISVFVYVIFFMIKRRDYLEMFLEKFF